MRHQQHRTKSTTPATAMAAICPDNQAVIFSNTVAEDATVLPWSKLPINTWFRITDQKDIYKRKTDEQVKIITLMREGGDICKVWTTPIIAEKIEGEKLHCRDNFPAHLYIRSKGKTRSAINADRSYFDCTLRYY